MSDSRYRRRSAPRSEKGAPVSLVFDTTHFDRDGTMREMFECMGRDTRHAALDHLFAAMPKMLEAWYDACGLLVAEIDDEELEREFGARARQICNTLIDRARSTLR